VQGKFHLSPTQHTHTHTHTYYRVYRHFWRKHRGLAPVRYTRVGNESNVNLVGAKPTEETDT